MGLVLYWQANQTLATDYKVFVHLVGPSDTTRIWSQRDQLPDGGAYSVKRWQPKEVVADRVQLILPSAIPSGSYDLLIGMYDAVSGQRLPLLDRDGRPLDDKVTLRKRVHLP